MYVNNQEQIVQQKDTKYFEFGQKGSSSKAMDCKDRAGEILIAEKK